MKTILIFHGAQGPTAEILAGVEALGYQIIPSSQTLDKRTTWIKQPAAPYPDGLRPYGIPSFEYGQAASQGHGIQILEIVGQIDPLLQQKQDPITSALLSNLANLRTFKK